MVITAKPDYPKFRGHCKKIGKWLNQVLVVATEMLPGGKMAYNAPLKYSEILETTATLRVEGKTQDAKIELTWGGQKGPIVVSTNE